MNRWIVGVNLFVAMACLTTAPSARARESWRYAVKLDENVLGRFEAKIVERDNLKFASSAFVKGAKAVESKKRGTPDVRSYAELDATGAIGKYKRWKNMGKVDSYWMYFVAEKKVKLRYVPATKPAQVNVIAPEAPMVPLEPDQPHLAVMLIDKAVPERTVECVGASPQTKGHARVTRAIVPQVDSTDATETTTGESDVTVWKIDGDCGTFEITLNSSNEPVLMKSGDVIYERLP